MKRKTVLKIVVFSIANALMLIGTVILFLWLIPNPMGAMLGFVLGFAILCLGISYKVPVWFKDYFEEFWKKEEEKKNDKEKAKQEVY